MYLFKSILISSVIYLFYKLFLQKETFFHSIRWYFLIGILISLMLPLFIIPIYVEVELMVAPKMEIINNIPEISAFRDFTSPEIEKPIDWQFWAQALYLAGGAFFLLKFIFELFSLTRLIRTSRKKTADNYQFIETNTEISPFSFFSYIVYNKNHFKAHELQSILEHEKVHVNQIHSLDIILVQLFVVFQWFNPFVWLYKKDLQQNLEYIADKVAQQQAETHKKYQYLLLKTSIKNNSFALSNNFFNSQLKKRIKMLQKSQTKKLNQLKYVLLLPLIALFLYSFNRKEVYIQKGNESLNFKNKTIIIDVSHGGKDPGTSINGYDEKELVLSISKKIANIYNGNASIIFTRNKDEFVSLNDRINQINTKNPDLVISLHINMDKDARKNGVIAYVSDKNNEFKKSKDVASILLQNLSGVNLKNNGISKSSLKINSEVDCPSVVLELGYLSNDLDRAYLVSYEGQQEIAQSIVDFINGKQGINKSSFILPVHKENILSVSGYGMRINPITKKKSLHKGIDINAYSDMDVYAVASGRVISTGFDTEKGNFIEIEHKNGLVTNYQYLGNVQVEQGSVVSPGEIIGIVGSTGKSVAPHLHFEVLIEGKNVNPMNYLPKTGVIYKKKSNQERKKSDTKPKFSNSLNSFKHKDKEIKNLSMFILKNMTNKELNTIKQSFKSKTGVVLTIYDVKRNIVGEITAIKIDGKKGDNFSSFSISRTIPIDKIKVSYKEEENKIFIANYFRETKLNPLDDIFETSNASSGFIKYKGKTYFLSIHKPTNYGCMEDGKALTESKISEREAKNVSKLTINGKTFYQYGKVVVIDFYNKFGNDVSIDLSKNLRKQYEKTITSEINKTVTDKPLKQGWIYYKDKAYFYNLNHNKLEFLNKYGDNVETKLAGELLLYFNNKYNSNYHLTISTEKPTNQGWTYYKKKAYFYNLKHDKLEFIDKYGAPVEVNLAKELLKNFNEDYSTSYVLNKLQPIDLKYFEITKVDTLAIRKTINDKIIRINDKNFTIDEAKKVKIQINKFVINIKSINSDELHGYVASGTTMKIKDEKGTTRLVTFGGNGYTLDENPVSAKMGWIYYKINDVEYQGYYFITKNEMLLFNEKGIPLAKKKAKQILTFLKSK